MNPNHSVLPIPAVPTMNSGRERLTILDTTLRDGEQAPGFSMTGEVKLRIARALAELRVDVIEAGFAATSPADEEALRIIAQEVGGGFTGPVICSLARANERDIRAAARALAGARRARVHVFISTSPLHRRAKLGMSAAEVLKAASEAVSFACSLFADVEFSAEDAIRTEPEFLAEVMEAAAEAGARTLNLPDTVGYATPEEMFAIFSAMRARLMPRFPGIVLSAHCHDDLGMAVANSLAAVRAGARQIEVSINGIGERAGNCSLEEAVMAIRTRPDVFGVETGVETTKLLATSQMVSELTSAPVSRNKAVVGANAFAHEAGIHQHGMLADARTYEIMRPEDVGFAGSRLVLGRHSGHHAIAARAAELGHQLGSGETSAVMTEFKARAEAIGEIDDAELLAIIAAVTGPAPEAPAMAGLANVG